MEKTSLDAVNSALESAGVTTITPHDPHPERTYYHKLIEDGCDDPKKLRSARNAYREAFHRYFADVYPHMRFEIGEDKTYWNYNPEEGIYEELNAVTVRGLVIKLLIDEGLYAESKDATVKEILHRYRAMYPERGSAYDDFDHDGDFFHAQNGWVNLRKGSLLPHTPDRLSRRKSATPFDPNATCPTYDRFLDHDMELKDDQVRVIDQFSGLCLVGDISHQKMLTLIGRPGSGKSTLLDSWVHVLGDMAVERKLTELTGDAMRFSGASFVGSTLCWFDEVDVKKAEMGNTLGTLITGSHINIERKGVNGIVRGKNTMKCVLTANRLPNTAELGIYRRLILINLPHSFTENYSALLDIPERLRSESSGILNRMIRGFQDLRKMGTFTVISGHDALIEEYKAQSDTVAEFLDTFFEPGTDEDMVFTDNLIASYRHFTGEKTFMLITPQKFGRLLFSQPLTRFARIESTKKYDDMGTQKRAWKRLKLKPGYSFNPHTLIIEEDNF